MKKERRVGTFTLGLSLIVFGILFGLHQFFPSLDYLFVFRLWPIVFILLGCEILTASIRTKDVSFRYDFAAIFIICLLMVFAMGMACVDTYAARYISFQCPPL
ncbi:MAG: hypothetical protein PUB10_00560 [Clostridiales bacterium]|nr:hypothetical protein [Clostridiales bacterium]